MSRSNFDSNSKAAWEKIMARAPVLAAGGIVLRQERPPRIAVVRLRKRDEWVLPKGKLDDGETARAAAEREVLEETGHQVHVHEFLGTLVYESGGRFKVVHYWRMEARGGQVHELMSDVREVDWLPLDAAVERLSRSYERAFLENVGPHAIEAAAVAAPARRSRAKSPPARKRASSPLAKPEPPSVEDIPVPPPQPEVAPAPPMPEESLAVADDMIEAEAQIETPADPVEITIPDQPEAASAPSAAEPEACDVDAAASTEPRPRSFAQIVRNWLRRAA
jgi:8-oxo-dGTP diphosphatase